MDDSFVVLSAVHPVAGRLYLEVIEEDSVEKRPGHLAAADHCCRRDSG
ncbi:TPA: hypothetical protein ACOXWE_004595 [Salmonella enterica]